VNEEIRKTLRYILEYIGCVDDYWDNAQLISYLEWLIKKAKEEHD